MEVFQEEIKVAQKTAVTPQVQKVSTDGPDDNSQQGPEHTEARPRADSSSVVGCNDADLEPTTDELDRERKRERTAPQSKDWQPRNRCQTCSKHESGKRARKLHRGKPADNEVHSQVSKDGRIQQEDGAPQGKREGALKRLHSAERLYTAKKAREDRIPHPAERLISNIQDRGNGHPRAMQERSVNNKTRNRI